MAPLVVTVYGRHDCPLCDEALDLVRLLQKEYGYAVEEINITTDLELFERFKHTVPVIAVNGRPRLMSLIDEGDLRRLLDRLGAGN